MGNSIIKLDNVKVWRLNLKPSSQKGIDVFDFCKSRNLVGFGWVLSQKPQTIEQCIQWGQKEYNDRGFSRAITAMRSVKEDDLIWTRKDGVYYLSRVKNTWKYNDSEEFRAADIVNMVEVHDFVEIGTWDVVPGSVQRSFIPPSTFQRVNSIENITTAIYNNKAGLKIYETKTFSKDDLLQKMLSPEDIEEIVCLYLQVEKHYVLYSSTCKKGTELYECVMVKNDGSHKCYPQVKTGDKDISGSDYVHLTEQGKDYVYLFATSQKYIKVPDNKNIIYLDTDTILNFMEAYEKILPERMRHWLQFVKG